MTIINQTIAADIIDPGLDLTLGGDVLIGFNVSKIIVRSLSFLNDTTTGQAVVIQIETPGLLIKSQTLQGRAAVSWKGAGTHVSARSQRAGDGQHGAHGVALAANAFGREGNAGAPGQHGTDGQSGSHGVDAPSLRIAYSDLSSFGCLFVDLRGQHGQPGQDGGHGGDGGNGSSGGPPQIDPWCTACTVPPGRGGTAGDGGDGGNGGNGGNGGSGGYLQVCFAQDSLIPPPHPVLIIADTTAGHGQHAGKPGVAGKSGEPGLGSSSLGPCKVNEEALSGALGHDGRSGNPGEPGVSGTTPPPIIKVISVAEYNLIN